MMMVPNLTFNDVDKLDEVMDFVTGGAARPVSNRNVASPKASGASPVVSGISPAGRSIATGRDLLRSPIPLGWSNR
jgi:hypothetical protein